MAEGDELYTPVPPGTAPLFSPVEALRAITQVVDEKYRPYFQTGSIELLKGPAIPVEERRLISELRGEILEGGNVERVFDNINPFLTPGETFAQARGQIGAVLRQTRYVEPIEDPLGRGEFTPGFGRGTEGMPPSGAVDVEPGEVARETGGPPEPVASRVIEGEPASEQARAEFEAAMATAGPVTDVEDEPGGVPGGGSVVGGVGPAPVETGVPEDWEAAAAEIYGGYYAIIKQNQEIADLLLLATTEKWDDAKFQYQLEQTNWWKDTTGFAREFDMREARDPATVGTEIRNRAATLREYGLSIGLPPGSVDYETIARDSLRMGWSDQVTENAVGYRATQTTPGAFGLVRGYYGNQVRDLMREYGQSLDAETLRVYANDLATGNQSLETLKFEAVEAAKTLFPGLADRLDRGQTFQQIARPYRNTAAAILEVDPNSIDFTNPDWAQIFTYVDPKGEQRPMNYNEMGDYLRTTRSFGYEYTDQAKQKAYQVANQLADLFGRA